MIDLFVSFINAALITALWLPLFVPFWKYFTEWAAQKVSLLGGYAALVQGI